MNIKTNFQRHLILTLLFIFDNIFLTVSFIILKFYNVPFLFSLLIFISMGLYYNFFYMDYSKKIFKKYCNKQCKNCSMWHCDYHFEDNKYIK